MIEVSKEGPHEPAPAILSQRALPRLRPLRRGPHSDPYPEGAPLSLQTLWADFHRDQRYRLLPDAQAEVVGACGGYPTLAYGCPVQAIVAAFGIDERTVARWQREAGSQCKRAHEHLVEAGRVQLLQVQADEIRFSRLWVGSTG